MQPLSEFLESINSITRFDTKIGELGGYINLRNSGQRGSVKEFTLSIASIIQGLKDIKTNIAIFAPLSTYNESNWRHAGSNNFTDLALNSLIQVQTKPCFSTLSKIICWANGVTYSNDNSINLSIPYLDQAIDELQKLSLSFSPPPPEKAKPKAKNELVFENNTIRYFAKDVITYFHKNHNSQFHTLAQRNQTNTSKITLAKLANVIKEANQKLTIEELSSGEANTQRFFEECLSENDKYWYISTQWTGEDGDRGLCFNNLKQFVEQNFKDYILKSELGKYLLLKVNSLNTLAKPFILLAGISGTGKSRFVRKQAEKWPDTENFELVSVRPDWHEPSDLLGYVLRLKDKPEFISTPVIKFLVSAWLEAYKQGIVLEKNENNQLIADCTGRQIAPFWLCLDEMNLAPVEQYFSDYLSLLETREWNGDIYSCDPLIKPEFLKDVINENESQFRKSMGLKDESEDSNHDALWMFIKENGLPIPFNLIVAGTVNMDETTHGFSRKVIDRALSLDFGEFFPNDFDSFFNQTSKPKTLSYPTLSHSCAENVGDYAQASIDFLNVVNAVLKGTLFELAYRALNECLLAVACEQPEDEKHLQAVWDDFLMMKVLPRIEGDEDKLQSPNTDDDNLFIALENLLKTQFDQIWEGKNRPDLLRENINDPKEILIECRSKTKIQRMNKLSENGFTSFWP